jgi:hypothetical protein
LRTKWNREKDCDCVACVTHEFIVTHEATLQAAHDCQRVIGAAMRNIRPTAAQRFHFDLTKIIRPWFERTAPIGSVFIER